MTSVGKVMALPHCLRCTDDDDVDDGAVVAAAPAVAAAYIPAVAVAGVAVGIDGADAIHDRVARLQ